MASLESKHAPSLTRSRELHDAMSLFHTSRPVKLDANTQASDFVDIGRDGRTIYAKHKDKTLYRATNILKNGARGLSKYYARYGAPCYAAPKAKRWLKRVEDEHKEQMQLFEAAVANAAQQAKQAGGNVEEAIEAVDTEFHRMFPGFGIVL
jgi:hypothetical protein